MSSESPTSAASNTSVGSKTSWSSEFSTSAGSRSTFEIGPASSKPVSTGPSIVKTSSLGTSIAPKSSTSVSSSINNWNTMPTRGSSTSVSVAPNRTASASAVATVSQESGIAAGGVKALQQRLAGTLTGGMAGAGAGVGAKTFNTLPSHGSSYRTGTVSAGYGAFNPHQKAPSHVANSSYVRQSGVAAGSLASFVGQALGVQHKGEHTGLTRIRNENTEQQARVEHANRGANTAMAALMGNVVKQAQEVSEGKTAPESASVAYLAKKLQGTTVVEAVGNGSAAAAKESAPRSSVSNIASRFGGSVGGPTVEAKAAVTAPVEPIEPAPTAAGEVEEPTVAKEDVQADDEAEVEEKAAPIDAEQDDVAAEQQDEEWEVISQTEMSDSTDSTLSQLQKQQDTAGNTTADVSQTMSVVNASETDGDSKMTAEQIASKNAQKRDRRWEDHVAHKREARKAMKERKRQRREAELEVVKAANGGVLPPREPREAGLKENPEFPFKFIGRHTRAVLERIQSDKYINMDDVNGYYQWMRAHNQKNQDIGAKQDENAREEEEGNEKRDVEQENEVKGGEVKGETNTGKEREVAEEEIPPQFIPPVVTSHDKNNKLSSAYNPVNPSLPSLNPTLVLDCDHEHLMVPSEVYSLVKQLAHCYGSNCRAKKPMKMIVNGVINGSVTDIQLNKYSGSDAWVWQRDTRTLVEALKKRGVEVEEEDRKARVEWEEKKRDWEKKNGKVGEKSIVQQKEQGVVGNEGVDKVEETTSTSTSTSAAPSTLLPVMSAPADPTYPQLLLPSLSHVVYLTAESDNVLDTIEDDTCYVVGGIVDHNRLKGHAHGCAAAYGMKTARLPLDVYMEKGQRTVLTTINVVDLLLARRVMGWKEAMQAILPMRWKWVSKENKDKDAEGEAKGEGEGEEEVGKEGKKREREEDEEGMTD